MLTICMFPPDAAEQIACPDLPPGVAGGLPADTTCLPASGEQRVNRIGQRQVPRTILSGKQGPELHDEPGRIDSREAGGFAIVALGDFHQTVMFGDRP